MMGTPDNKSIWQRGRQLARAAFARVALPQSCLLCADPLVEGRICAACCDELPGRDAVRCPVCADISATGERCGRCLAEPPHYARIVTALSFRFPVDAVIRRLKYGRDLALVEPLAALLAERVCDEPAPDLLLPMPLAAQRMRARGFNQALELSRTLAATLALQLDTRNATRTRDTRTQAGLPFDERRRNVRGAFAWSGRLDGARVAVIDDVLTTGATLDELAKTLRKAGAAEVVGWVIARAERF